MGNNYNLTYNYNLTHKSAKEKSNAGYLTQFPAENKKEQSLLKNEVFITDLGTTSIFILSCLLTNGR